MSKRADDLVRLRAWWFDRQGLAGRARAQTVVDAVRRAGWLPTAGSTGVYLSLRARAPGIAREAVDRAAIDGVEVMEVPGPHARPPVLAPRDEMGLALRLHAASFDKHAAPQFANGRYSEAAFKAIAAQACRALDEEPLSTSGIRARVTHPEAGDLLTGALISLALRGIIRRFPSDGRLDSSNYQYELRHPDDRPDVDAEGDAAAVTMKAVRLFLRRHGPATLDEMFERMFLTKGAMRKSLAALDAVRISIDSWSDEAWLLPEDAAAWRSFEARDDRVVLLPYRDPFVSVRRPQAILARDGESRVLNTELRTVPIRGVSVLHHHAIVSAGEMVGVWEYDPDSRRLVTRVWTTNKTVCKLAAAAAADTEQFIRQQLGDAKLSAVDPPARRAKRLAFCRR